MDLSHNVRPGLFLAVITLLAPWAAQAQIELRLENKRSLYIRYEPVVLTVEITNNAGRDVFLADDPGRQWFGLEVMMDDGRVLPPLDRDYEIKPLLIANGQSVKRQFNITPLFPIDGSGLYRVRALVYSVAAGRYFTSNQIHFNVIEGQTIWRKDFGVPNGMEGAGQNRTVQLLSHRLPSRRLLYVRVSNPDTGTIYTTTELGRLATYVEAPQVVSDRENTLHILQLYAPKTFLYTKLDLNGRILDRKPIYDARTRPRLKMDDKGGVRVSGGSNSPEGAGQAGGGVPRASDRPAELPPE